MRQPLVLTAFHEALKGLLQPLPRLSGLALCARLCFADLERTQRVGPSCHEDNSSGQSHCDKAQSDGLFTPLYNSFEDVLKAIQLSESEPLDCITHCITDSVDCPYKLHGRLCTLRHLEAML